MSIFAKKKQREHSSLLVVIESGIVRMGVVLSTPRSLPMLIFETERRFKGDTADSTELMTRMLSAMNDCADDVTREALPHIVSRRISRGIFDSIRCVYGTPWYVSRGRNVLVERKDPTLFTSRALNDIVSENIRDILPFKENEGTVIERYALGFAIEGYPVNDPTNKKGRRLGMTLFASAIGTNLKQTVEKAIGRFFRASEMTHHSFPLALSRVFALHDNKKSASAILLADISDFATELTLIDHGIVLDTVSFPVGWRSIHKENPTHAPHKPSEKKFLDAPHVVDLKEAVLIQEKWAPKYREALHEIISAQAIPTSTVLLTEESMRDGFIGSIKEIAREQMEKPFIEALSRDSYKTLYATSASVKSAHPTVRMLTVWENGLPRTKSGTIET